CRSHLAQYAGHVVVDDFNYRRALGHGGILAGWCAEAHPTDYTSQRARASSKARILKLACRAFHHATQGSTLNRWMDSGLFANDRRWSFWWAAFSEFSDPAKSRVPEFQWIHDYT